MRKITSALVVVCVILLISSCGGGGGGSSGTSSTVVTGVASAGLLNGSTVCAYAITSSLKGTQIGDCQPTSSGNYSINLGTYTGAVLFEATGGSYVDEASGSTIPLSSTLHGFLTTVTSGNNSVAITPLTEVAYLNANAMSGGLTNANIQSAITGVENNFGVTNIVNTLPVDALNVPANATAAQKNYALALAMVSQYIKDQSTTLDSALQSMQACLSSPTTGCVIGNTTIGTLLNTAQNTFQTNNQSLSGLALPVSNLGYPYDGTYIVNYSDTRLSGSSQGQIQSGSFTITVTNGVITATIISTNPPATTPVTGLVSQFGVVTIGPASTACVLTLTGQAIIMSTSVGEMTGTLSEPISQTCDGSTGIWTAIRTSLPIANVAQFNGNYNASTVESGTGIVQPFSFTATNGVIAGSTFGGTISGAISSTGAVSMSFSGGVCNTSVSVAFAGQTVITALSEVIMTGTWSDPGVDPPGGNCAPASGTWTATLQ